MEIISFPPPRQKGKATIEECFAARRSHRSYRDTPLSLADAGQLLWAAQGITGPEKQRTAPSAGALYPLEVYLVAGNVEGLPPGIYRYNPQRHQILPLSGGDRRREIAAAALDQEFLTTAAVIFVFTGSLKRIAKKYPEHALRLMTLEAGHVAENILLQAVALGLGAITIGAFDEEELKRILKPSTGEEPLYMVAAGAPATR